MIYLSRLSHHLKTAHRFYSSAVAAKHINQRKLKMKFKSKIAALAVACIVGAGLLLASPAQAGSSLCPAYMNCLYQDANFVSLLGYRGADVTLFNLSTAANDKMTSWENKSWNDAAYYENINGGGFCRSMLSGTENANVGAALNDKMSSWKTTGRC